jgi:cell division protein FtsL
MSRKPSDYGDSQDRVDYQVIKSYGRTSKLSERFFHAYLVVLCVLIIILLLMLVFQSSTIKNLETTVKNLESKITDLETKVRNLETEITDFDYWPNP